MGKNLIIKGADFSANAIENEQYELFSIENRSLVILQSSVGSLSTTSSSNYRINMFLAGHRPILIPNGKSIKIKGLRGTDGQKPTLTLDYVYYSTNQEVTASSSPNANAVGTASNYVSDNYFSINRNELLDEVIITNNYGSDYYFGFVAKAELSNSGNEQQIPVSNYSTLRYRIE